MTRLTRFLTKIIFLAMYYTRIYQVFAWGSQRKGVIFMLHHVDPKPQSPFDPNRILRITPEFLEQVIQWVQANGYDIISLDDVPQRLKSGKKSRPFVCFTFDDGYRDNRDHAYPILKKYNAPFTVYVPSAYPNGQADLWWVVLEDVLRTAKELTVLIDGTKRQLSLHTDAEKNQAYDEIYWWLRSISEKDARRFVQDLADSVGWCPKQRADELLLNWDELLDFSKDPLVTIGGHTKNHFALAGLSAAEAESEIREGNQHLQNVLRQHIRHFSYPYGSSECAGSREFEMTKKLDMVTAVTTQKGLLYEDHANALTSLPRLSLNGDFQDLRFIAVMLSGLPFLIWNFIRKVMGLKADIHALSRFATSAGFEGSRQADVANNRVLKAVTDPRQASTSTTQ